MNKQFTPSPWTLKQHGLNHQTLTGASAGLIADIHKDEDAHLIAAAPELLAALQMVNRIWSNDQAANLAPDSPVAIVRAAIAKAVK